MHFLNKALAKFDLALVKKNQIAKLKKKNKISERRLEATEKLLKDAQKQLNENALPKKFALCCNICGSTVEEFEFIGVPPRKAQCPCCGSLERHRHLYLYLMGQYPFLNGSRVLHFAPEKVISDLFIEANAEYYDCDVVTGKTRYQVDITDIPYEDNHFDYAVIMHVFEHIVDDTKAMKEVFRVLKPNGILYTSVPCPLKEGVKEGKGATPKERMALYGHRSHVRKYSLSVFTKRLIEVGFDVAVGSIDVTSERFSQYNLGDNICLCKKK